MLTGWNCPRRLTFNAMTSDVSSVNRLRRELLKGRLLRLVQRLPRSTQRRHDGRAARRRARRGQRAARVVRGRGRAVGAAHSRQTCAAQRWWYQSPCMYRREARPAVGRTCDFSCRDFSFFNKSKATWHIFVSPGAARVFEACKRMRGEQKACTRAILADPK